MKGGSMRYVVIEYTRCFARSTEPRMVLVLGSRLLEDNLLATVGTCYTYLALAKRSWISRVEALLSRDPDVGGTSDIWCGKL